MQIIGIILIVLALADFALSWMGINLTPFLPDAVSRFSPIIIGAVGYFFLNAQNMGNNDDPALDRFKTKPKRKSKKK